MGKVLNASIVIYGDVPKTFVELVRVLRKSASVNEVMVVDNSREEHAMPEGVEYVHSGENVGYGRGHNVALRRSMEEGVKYHLVLNADIKLAEGDLERLVERMEREEKVGLLMPKVVGEDGEVQRLCKLLPRPSDLLVRRFMPESWCKARKERFEMAWTGYEREMMVPYLSGCFMLLRVDALREVGVFDERYFLYPEDVDLSRRMARRYENLYYPEVTIVHLHERSSYKSVKMMLVHAREMGKYFCKWGWVCDKEREELNAKALGQFEKKQN